MSSACAFGPMVGNGNHQSELREIVERVNELDQRILTSGNMQADVDWEGFYLDLMEGVGGNYWDDLDDWTLQQAERFAEKIISKYKL